MKWNDARAWDDGKLQEIRANLEELEKRVKALENETTRRPPQKESPG